MGARNAAGSPRKTKNVGNLSALCVVSGVSGAPIVAALSPVEEDQSLLQEQYYSTQPMGERSAADSQ